MTTTVQERRVLKTRAIDRPKRPNPDLTLRERQVLTLVASGLSSKEIARDLGLSYRTVDIHRQRAVQKFGARNSQHMVALAVYSGYVTIVAPAQR